MSKKRSRRSVAGADDPAEGRAPQLRMDQVLSEADAFADVPMFREPGHVSGQPGEQFSPAGLYALTRVERTDVDPRDEDLWMTEEPLRTVHKGVFMLFRQRFAHDRLAPYSTGPKGRPRADLVVRYNRALLARGVLEEVKVLQRMDGGEYQEICRARPEAEYIGRADWADVIRVRNARFRDLVGKRAMREQEYIALESGTEALERLVDEQLARERLRRRTRPEAIVASPIYAEREADVRRTSYQEALASPPRSADTSGSGEDATVGKPSGASPGRANRGSRRKEEPKRGHAAEDAVGEKSAPRAKRSPNAPPKTKGDGEGTSLGKALGGRIGFGLDALKRVP